MTDITVAQHRLSMTSREIADLTGKKHPHVMRDIRVMLEQLYCDSQNPNLDAVENKGFSLVEYGTNNAGVPVCEYHLDKDHTLTLLTGYDAKARHRVVKRWQELEADKTIPSAITMDSLANSLRNLANIVGVGLDHQGRIIEQVQSRVESVETQMTTAFTKIDHRFDNIESRLAKRAHFSQYARRLFNSVVHQFYAGRCPCCQTTAILGPHGEPLPDVLRYDHWNGKQHNMISNGWAVCVSCNRSLEQNRHERHLAFQLFHQNLARINVGDQLALPLKNVAA